MSHRSPPLAAPFAALIAAPLAACGGGATAAGPAPPQPPAGAAAAAPAPPAGPVVPPLPGGGERAYVAGPGGLVEVSTAGGSQVIAPAATWCDADARASVVWFVSPAGLQAFDLTDRRVHPVVRGAYGELEPIIDWGAQRLGGESKVLFDVGAALRLASGAPALELEMGCEGDRAVYCFGDDGATPTDEVARLRQAVGNLRLADPAYAAQLARRGARGSLWTPPPAPPAPPARKPAVDRRQCEDRSTCGALTAIPGSPLWLVQTANSRGDYYHETRELWDPATGEYVRQSGARLARTRAAPPDTTGGTDYRGLRVSPAGALSYGGAVFDAARVHYAPPAGSDSDGEALSCGWAGGGWRIAGPTDN